MAEKTDTQGRRDQIVDARDCFFFVGLAALAGGAGLGVWHAAGIIPGVAAALTVSGAVLLYQAMRG